MDCLVAELIGPGHLGHRNERGDQIKKGVATEQQQQELIEQDLAKYSLNTVNCFINYYSTLIIFGCNVAYIAEKHDCVMFGAHVVSHVTQS